jgi:tetratricopeptide (TPR) repeat protein
LHLWSLEHGEEVCTLASDSLLLGVAFEPRGRRIVAVDYDGALRVWETERDVARSMARAADLRCRARTLIDPLFDELLLTDEVVARLERDSELDEDLRRCAVVLARMRMELRYPEANEQAWSLVDPDRPQRDTDVARGLALARAAIRSFRSVRTSASEEAPLRNTLAWALYANGLYAEAIAESERALELAPRKRRYAGFLERLRALVAAAEGAADEVEHR